MEKGIFFHTLYRMMVKLGRTFVDLEPYGLYPLQRIFLRRAPETSVQPIPTRQNVRSASLSPSAKPPR